MTKACFEIES